MNAKSKSSEPFDMKDAVESMRGVVEIANMVILVWRTVKTEVDDWNARPKKVKKAKKGGKHRKADLSRIAVVEKRLDLMEGRAANRAQVLPFRRVARVQNGRRNVKRKELA